MRRVSLLVDSVLSNGQTGKTSIYCLFTSGYRRLQEGEILYGAQMETYRVLAFFPVRGSISAGEPKAFITIDKPFPQDQVGSMLYTNEADAKRHAAE